MATLTTKFSIGDRVWHASTSMEQKQHPCPDCLGSRKWAAQSPAGHEYSFTCPRCDGGYKGHNEASLAYTTHEGSARSLTIGSVRVDTADERRSVQYMCRETGVGSGSVYNEADLFSTQEEALAAAKALAVLRNQTHTYVVGTYNRSLEVRDYQLDDAILRRAKEERSKARMLVYGIEDLMDNVNQASDIDGAREAVENYREWDHKRDREKLAADEAESAPC